MKVDLLTFSLIISEFGGTSINKYRSIEKQATLAVGWLITSDAQTEARTGGTPAVLHKFTDDEWKMHSHIWNLGLKERS